MRLWHTLRGHHISMVHIPATQYDMPHRLYKCSCRKRWAK